MAVPTLITDLSTTPASNSPAGSENVFPNLDDYLRVQAAFLASVRDNSGNGWVSPYLPLAGGTMTGSVSGFTATTGTFSGNVQMASANGGQLAGLRNKIINGDMRIAQRGTSTAAAPVSTYLVDRTRLNSYSTTAVVTTSQSTDAPNSQLQYSARVTVTTADAAVAASDQMVIMQSIEGYNVRDLIGTTFTLSFWVRSSKTGIHCVAFNNSIADRSYVIEYTISVANAWEYKTITVSGGLITAGTWDWTNGVGLSVRFALMVGSSYQTTVGAWNTGNFFGTSSQVNCLDTIGNIFAITGVQLEVGPVATPFEQRPYGMELALCQRYYEQGSLGVTTYGSTSQAFNFSFKVTKRAAPTINLSSITYSNASAMSTSNITVDKFDASWLVTAIGNTSVSAAWTTSGAEL